MLKRTRNLKAPLDDLTVPGTTRFVIATGAPGFEFRTRYSDLPFGPLTAVTVRSSLTDWLDGLPGLPARAAAVPVPTIAFLHLAGTLCCPSISLWLQNGKYLALLMMPFEKYTE